jgi:two-component system NarL family response regulator
MIGVYVIEREQIARSGLEVILSQDPELEVLGLFENGSSCLEAVCRQAPDIIVTSLDIQGMAGAEFIKALKEVAPKSRIVVFTAQSDDASLLNSFNAGADAFVPKGSTINMLVQAVKGVAGGAVWLDPIIARRALKLATELAVMPQPEVPAGTIISNRETEVLRLIMDGLTNAQIGGRLYLCEDTVKSHVRSILKKLDVKTRTQAATKAVELGLIVEQVKVPA